MNDLQIENTTTNKWLHPYEIDEDSDTISLPYHYARETLGLSAPERAAFPSLTPETCLANFTGELRDYQKEVKREVVKLVNRQGCCVLSLHVGWGKSMLAVYLGVKLGFKTLIIVNKLILVKQWRELVAKVCPDSVMQFVKPKTCGERADPKADFYIMNALNVPKLPRDYFIGVGTVVADEIHTLCATTLFKAFFPLTPRYFIGLSATPTRPDGLDALIDLYFGKARISKKLYRNHTVYAVHTGLQLKYDLNWEGRMDWNSMLNSQAEHETRNDLIIDIVRMFPTRFFLILCKRVAHGRLIVDALEQHDESVTNLLGTKRDFDENARIVVATSQKCGVGFSHDKLNTLLLAADMKEYFIQYLGRVFRTPDSEPIIFDLVDDNGILKSHFASRKSVYKSTGGTVENVYDINSLNFN